MGVLRANVGGTWVDIGNTTDVRVWNGAWGDVAQSKIIATQGGVSTTDTLLTGSVLPVTTIAGRRYRFSINASPLPDAGSTGAVWYKLRVDGVVVGGRTCTVTDPNTSQEVHIEYTHVETVSANRTFDVTIARYGGSGTVGNGANATTLPTWVTVEDMGPTAVTVLPPQPLVANPGNALGIIAVAVPANRPGVAISTTAENLGPPITCYTQAGRRYRLVVNGIRAATASPATYVVFQITGPGIINRVDWYRLLSTAYDSLNCEVLFDGQGVSGTYTVQVAAGAAGAVIWTEQQATYYIEDCGPLSPVGIADIVVPATVPWIPLPFATGWNNYGSGFQLPGYRKIGDIVYVRGLCNAGAGATSTIATLPAGYRPAAIELCVVDTTGTGGAQNNRVDIYPTGVITTPLSGTLSGQWVSLSPIQFSTTA